MNGRREEEEVVGDDEQNHLEKNKQKMNKKKAEICHDVMNAMKKQLSKQINLKRIWDSLKAVLPNCTIIMTLKKTTNFPPVQLSKLYKDSIYCQLVILQFNSEPSYSIYTPT